MGVRDEEKLELEEQFIEFASQYPNTALSLITGLFVGLLTSTIKNAGADPSQNLKIDGQGSRNITVHAVGHVFTDNDTGG